MKHNSTSLSAAITAKVSLVAGTLVLLFMAPDRLARRQDERGLSQSTENAILVAGAVTIALAIVGAVTVYVTKRLPK